jgi:hypothetical protein
VAKVSNKIRQFGTCVRGNEITSSVYNAIKKSNPIAEYNFDIESTDWSAFGITNQATFVSYFSGLGATDMVINDFVYSTTRIQSNLSCGGYLGMYGLGITKINSFKNLDIIATQFDTNPLSKIENISNLPNIYIITFAGTSIIKIENLNTLPTLTDLYIFQNSSLTQIDNIDDLINVNRIIFINNKLTTAEFNRLNTWAVNAPNNGNIDANGNIDNFNTSTTYATLLAKGWTIT